MTFAGFIACMESPLDRQLRHRPGPPEFCRTFKSNGLVPATVARIDLARAPWVIGFDAPNTQTVR